MTDQSRQHNPASDPPGALSDQNREDNQSGHRKDRTHPEPRTSGKRPTKHAPSRPSTGAAGEGSQSTGHSRNAG